MARRAQSIDALIAALNHLPGIGTKTAQRLAYHIIDMDEGDVAHLASTIVDAKHTVKKCRVCQNFTDEELCDICRDPTRDRSTICVVEFPKDVEALERSHGYHGLYHVLHGVISPSKGKSAEDISIDELFERLRTEDIREIILATNPTGDGETTALYLSGLLKNFDLQVSRIGYGLPVGGDLEFYDEVTISTALENRRILK
ncbi:recombination mediator RecR [Peptoniphilus equinus]|uniref:Recombination protein RecR n=1 Tax=Peptoniphilus equinus TaxID=3016343 RepID=A0ABY7QUP2_9FIRM|nr:recombination mediator RecR [Peptoniphilus equinus]WBW50496.1 recombination mediator RecR [Peptoniphilus equinus]